MANVREALAKIRQQLKELDGAKVIVGVQAEAGINFQNQTVSSDDEMCKIAWVHEFGCDIDVTPKMRAWLHYNGIHLKPETTKIHIPERSYIRRAHAEGITSYGHLYGKLIGEMFSDKITADELLEALGKQAMFETYGNLGVDTKPVTDYAMQHRKVSPNPTPLTDKGTLGNHITYRIKKKGGAK